MAEIQFYHLTSSPLERALPKLLEKALQGSFRAVVLMESEEKVEWLNNMLWSYDPASFLPHGSEKDGTPEQQPIYITTNIENPNDANLLVITDGLEPEISDKFIRVLDMFDGNNEEQVARARARWKQYKAAGNEITYRQQNENGSWKVA
jgi:DNA polymerase-3 subunit chi